MPAFSKKPTDQPARDPDLYRNASDRYDAQGNRIGAVPDEAGTEADQDAAAQGAFWSAVSDGKQKKAQSKNDRQTKWLGSKGRLTEEQMLLRARAEAHAFFANFNAQAARIQSEQDKQKRMQQMGGLDNFELEMLRKLQGPGASDVDRRILENWSRGRR